MRLVALRLIVAAVVAMGFAALVAALHARAAIANGALDRPVTCLNARNFDNWKAGRMPQLRMDGLLAQHIRAHALGRRRVSMGNWHLRGVWAQAGLWLGYGEASRKAMAMQAIGRMELCPRDRAKYQELKAAPPSPAYP